MKKILLTFCTLFLFQSLGFAQDFKQFFDSMATLCGQSFEGVAVLPEERNPMAGERLVVHFSECSSTELRLPFHVGDNTSRTWILTLHEEGLLFKHDHRHEDGTPDEVTNYGGWGNDEGNELQQFFPADDFTKELLPRNPNQTWSFAIDEEKQELHYMLYSRGNLWFKAIFDLKNPLH
jgi:hypothetical protein